MKDKIAKLARILYNSDNIVFFGGAGCSCESGIPDFRSSNGLFSKKLNKNLSPEQLVSHSFFIYHTDEFFDFYKKHLIYPDAKPNGCHIALAELEKIGKLKAVVTQNIDGLHQAAGSKNVFELHGSVHRNHCMKCNAFYDGSYVLRAEGVPVCEKCGGMVKPDVVLYEEGLDDDTVNGAVEAITKADVLIIGGTSLVVYPAAGLINYFRGSSMVLINKSSTTVDEDADLVISDNIADVMVKAVEEMKKI